MFNRKYKMKLTKNAPENDGAKKAEQMFEEQEKKIKKFKSQERKIKREKAIVGSFAIITAMGLIGLAMYLLIRMPLPKTPFARLIPWAIYIFVILPIFGWLIILINKHIFKD